MKLPASATAPAPASAGNSGGEDKKFTPIPANEIVNVVIEKCFVEEYSQWFLENYPQKDGSTHQVKFWFRVVDGDYEKRVLFGDAKANWYEDERNTCRLRNWTKTILGGGDLPDGYEFESDDFVGLNCRILVGEKFNKKKGEMVDCVGEVLRADTASASQTDGNVAVAPVSREAQAEVNSEFEPF